MEAVADLVKSLQRITLLVSQGDWRGFLKTAQGLAGRYGDVQDIQCLYAFANTGNMKYQEALDAADAQSSDTMYNLPLMFLRCICCLCTDDLNSAVRCAETIHDVLEEIKMKECPERISVKLDARSSAAGLQVIFDYTLKIHLGTMVNYYTETLNKYTSSSMCSLPKSSRISRPCKGPNQYNIFINKNDTFEDKKGSYNNTSSMSRRKQNSLWCNKYDNNGTTLDGIPEEEYMESSLIYYNTFSLCLELLTVKIREAIKDRQTRREQTVSRNNNFKGTRYEYLPHDYSFKEKKHLRDNNNNNAKEEYRSKHSPENIRYTNTKDQYRENTKSTPTSSRRITSSYSQTRVKKDATQNHYDFKPYVSLFDIPTARSSIQSAYANRNSPRKQEASEKPRNLEKGKNTNIKSDDKKEKPSKGKDTGEGSYKSVFGDIKSETIHCESPHKYNNNNNNNNRLSKTIPDRDYTRQKDDDIDRYIVMAESPGPQVQYPLDTNTNTNTNTHDTSRDSTDTSLRESDLDARANTESEDTSYIMRRDSLESSSTESQDSEALPQVTCCFDSIRVSNPATPDQRTPHSEIRTQLAYEFERFKTAQLRASGERQRAQSARANALLAYTNGELRKPVSARYVEVNGGCGDTGGKGQRAGSAHSYFDARDNSPSHTAAASPGHTNRSGYTQQQQQRRSLSTAPCRTDCENYRKEEGEEEETTTNFSSSTKSRKRPTQFIPFKASTYITDSGDFVRKTGERDQQRYSYSPHSGLTQEVDSFEAEKNNRKELYREKVDYPPNRRHSYAKRYTSEGIMGHVTRRDVGGKK